MILLAQHLVFKRKVTLGKFPKHIASPSQKSMLKHACGSKRCIIIAIFFIAFFTTTLFLSPFNKIKIGFYILRSLATSSCGLKKNYPCSGYL
jgi:hypothetical protein